MSEITTTVTVPDPNRAVKSFFADPDWRAKTALGATFNALSLVIFFFNPMLLPVVFIFWALVAGYRMRVMRTKIADPFCALPAWAEWVDLLISGLTWLAVYTGFVVFLLSIPTIAILVGSAQGSMFAPDPRFLTWSLTTFVLTFVLTLCVSLITTYLQANLAEEERTLAAFAVLKVLRKLRSHGASMVQAWLLSIGLFMMAIVVPTLTVVGIFLIPTAVFVAGTISATIVAQAWREAEIA